MKAELRVREKWRFIVSNEAVLNPNGGGPPEVFEDVDDDVSNQGQLCGSRRGSVNRVWQATTKESRWGLHFWDEFKPIRTLERAS